MRYAEVQPAPPLDRFVECFWTLTGDAGPHPVPQPVLPDGCTEWILNFADRFREQTGDGSWRRQPQHILAGQMNRRIVIAPTGRVDLLGIRFRPAGAAAFLRIPARELAGGVHALDSAAPLLAHALELRVGAHAGTAARVRAAEGALRAAMDGAGPGAAPEIEIAVEASVAQMVARHGNVSIGSLAAQAGLSRRQLERRFDRWVGLEPKLLCRILRFQRVFRAVAREPRARWVEIAVECGYYDQPHLIREFRAFAGMNPPAFFAQLSEFTAQFTRKGRAAHLYKTS